MFEHDIKIADRIGRKSRSALVAQSRGGKTFNGKLIVLVDSESASAAELFARVVQLEKRGIVVGDRSSGKVMESKFHPNQIETMGGVFRFGEFITESDLIMVDRKSLENVGVVPDQRTVPTPSDLTANRDPVLAHAAGQVGVNVTPEEAGKLFPIEWSSE
jgi:C-terminal processing protease CtpA/Prc